jgi:hypothetical protein
VAEVRKALSPATKKATKPCASVSALAQQMSDLTALLARQKALLAQQMSDLKALHRQVDQAERITRSQKEGALGAQIAQSRSGSASP